MAVVFTYTPPKIDARLRVHAATDAAEDAMAHALLDASQPLVPVEEGVLKASGRVVRDDTGAAVTYGKDDDGTGIHAPIDANSVPISAEAASAKDHAPSNAYVIPIHEDGTLNHPNGGEFKFLEKPMHAAGEAILGAAAVEMKRAFE